MSTCSKPRDYLFDNSKALLIFLVVIGHFIGPSTKCNDFLLAFKWLIVSFHMPAFVFVSGYFSKKVLPLQTIIQKLFIPYMVYEIFYFLLYTLVLHKKTGLLFLEPKFTLWYLLALCFWRMLTPSVKKLPYYMIWAVLAGLFIGFSNWNDGFLTIPRALFFYPFYLAGTNFQRSTLSAMRNKFRKPVFALLVFLVVSSIGIGAFYTKTSMLVFYGRYSYQTLQQGMFEGLFWRTLAYLIGFLITFTLMIFIPEKKTFFSYIGTRTMAIYLFHGLTYTYLNQSTDLFKNLDTPLETVLILLGCALITAVFSLKPFTTFTNMICNLKILSKKETA